MVKHKIVLVYRELEYGEAMVGIGRFVSIMDRVKREYPNVECVIAKNKDVIRELGATRLPALLLFRCESKWGELDMGTSEEGIWDTIKKFIEDDGE